MIRQSLFNSSVNSDNTSPFKRNSTPYLLHQKKNYNTTNQQQSSHNKKINKHINNNCTINETSENSASCSSNIVYNNSIKPKPKPVSPTNTSVAIMSTQSPNQSNEPVPKARLKQLRRLYSSRSYSAPSSEDSLSKISDELQANIRLYFGTLKALQCDKIKRKTSNTSAGSGGSNKKCWKKMSSSTSLNIDYDKNKKVSNQIYLLSAYRKVDSEIVEIAFFCNCELETVQKTMDLSNSKSQIADNRPELTERRVHLIMQHYRAYKNVVIILCVNTVGEEYYYPFNYKKFKKVLNREGVVRCTICDKY